MKNVVLFGIIILLFGCVNQYQGGNTTNITINNSSVSVTANSTLPANYAIQGGDTVWADYTLWVDGKVIDTSNATLANESGIYSTKRVYQPIEFEASLNKGMIDGFVLNVIGTKFNETITFDVPPEKGYGPYNLSKVITVPRYYTQSLYEVAPRSYFESMGVNITNGTMLSRSPMVFVYDYNDENVTLFYMFSTGQTFYSNNLPYNVINTTNESATLELLLLNNETYVLPHPETGTAMQFKVIEVAGQNITLDANHFLANETLTFRVTVTKIKHGALTIGG